MVRAFGVGERRSIRRKDFGSVRHLLSRCAFAQYHFWSRTMTMPRPEKFCWSLVPPMECGYFQGKSRFGNATPHCTAPFVVLNFSKLTPLPPFTRAYTIVDPLIPVKVRPVPVKAVASHGGFTQARLTRRGRGTSKTFPFTATTGSYCVLHLRSHPVLRAAILRPRA